MYTRYEGEVKKLVDTFCRRMESYKGVRASPVTPNLQEKQEGQALHFLYIRRKLDSQCNLDFVYKVKGTPITAELLLELEQRVTKVLALLTG
jgi:hypothetical protein